MRLLNIFKKKAKVAIIRLEGTISPAISFGAGLNDVSLSKTIEKAFSLRKASAVVLIINSPGGSPTQSSLIAARVRRLAEKNNVEVVAFCEDVAASGGYWLACAADEIFADENTIIGSIGVISSGFGFHELIERQGIERRVHTSGEDKSILDPFRPQKQKDIKKLKKLQKQIHDNFIKHVKSRRGNKILSDDVFSGEFWLAGEAFEKGLIDGVGHLEDVIFKKYGESCKLIFFSSKKSFIGKLSRSAYQSFTEGLINKINLLRFGL